MNAFAKTTQAGRDLFEINTSTLRKIVELSSDNLRKYVELNQDYFRKLPEVREFNAFVELQRDYGKSLWQGVQEDAKARGQILRGAAERTGAVIRDVFVASNEATEEAASA